LLPIVVSIVLFSAPCCMAAEVNQELDEVIVSASRVKEKIKKASATINVVGEKEVEKLKFRNPQEVLSRIPGIFSHDFGGESELTSIRVPTHFSNPYTLVLLDGIPISGYGSGSSGQFADINSDNIARIEVVKGPASALYGSNAIGGIINIITKTPTGKTKIKGWTELGSYENWRSGISGSGGSETFGFNLDFNHIDIGGWRENSKLEKRSGNAKFQYIPSDNSLLTFKVDLVTSDGESSGSIRKRDFESDWQQSYHTFAYSEMTRIAPSLSYTHYLDNGEFTATLALRDVENESIPQYAIRRQGPIFAGSHNQSENQAGNLQLLYNRDFDFMNSKLIVGLDGEIGDTESDTYNLLVNWSHRLNKYTSYRSTGLGKSYDITTTALAPYMQYELSPINNLRFNAGGRFDTTNYDVTDNLGGRNSGDKDFSQFSPKIGMTYDALPSLNLYASYAQGFVIPTTSQLLTSSWANIDLDPEKANNFEVGLRSSFLDKKLNLDAALFFMEIKDKIISQELGGWSKKYVNAGKTSQKGLELTVVYAPIDWLKFTLAYSYGRNEFDEYSVGRADYSGNVVPRSPDHRFNGRITVMPMEGLEVELEMDAVSTQYVDDANQFEYSRPALFNLRSNYSMGNWTFWAHIKNLTDEKYASYVSGSTTDGESYYSGSPLSAFVGVSYTWGK